jgi:hypothetical protein
VSGLAAGPGDRCRAVPDLSGSRAEVRTRILTVPWAGPKRCACCEFRFGPAWKLCRAPVRRGMWIWCAHVGAMAALMSCGSALGSPLARRTELPKPSAHTSFPVCAVEERLRPGPSPLRPFPRSRDTRGNVALARAALAAATADGSQGATAPAIMAGGQGIAAIAERGARGIKDAAAAVAFHAAGTTGPAAARQVGVAAVVLLRAPPPRLPAAAFPVLAPLAAAILLLVALLPNVLAGGGRLLQSEPGQSGSQGAARQHAEGRPPRATGNQPLCERIESSSVHLLASRLMRYSGGYCLLVLRGVIRRG